MYTGQINCAGLRHCLLDTCARLNGQLRGRSRFRPVLLSFSPRFIGKGARRTACLWKKKLCILYVIHICDLIISLITFRNISAMYGLIQCPGTMPRHNYHLFLLAIINPRRACAARVTVVVLCVCLFVCQRLFSHYRLRGGL